MGLFKKSNKNQDLLKTFDGREVKYVTLRNAHDDGTVTYDIIGKAGRIAVVGENIRIICGEIDVFTCKVSESKYYLLMSGDGVTVEGQNAVSGNYDIVTAYYTYYRK
ncbi:MAG: hypothetical protein Q4B40_01800 [Clostridia bacterium]|nr:hypothetical protein [Clostridia bacterium]